MFLLVQFLQDDYWTVDGVGTNSNDYNPTENQKIVETDEWPTNGEWKKEDLLWDDKKQKLIMFPPSLKVEIYKKKKLEELGTKILKSDMIVDKSIITNTVSAVKSAKDEAAVDAALNNIDVAKKDYLKSLGL